MSRSFKELLAPLSLRNKTAPSRIIFGAHQTNFALHNRFEARHAAYYAARAAGGAGVIVLEGSLVHPSDWPYEYAIFGYEESVVPGYRLAAEAIQAHGALVLAHLTHSGGQGTSHYSQQPLWAPSPVPEVNSREVPKEMELEDIAAIVEGFGRAAGSALAGGLDGVEINAGQDSLLRQFMSPLTNLRQDEYGGGLENRLRLVRQVIGAVRRQLGGRAIIGLRLSGDEYAPWAGLKPEDTRQIAQLLAAEGQLDFISVTGGSIYSKHLTRAGLYMPPGYAAHLAAGIKAAVQIPVFAQGSIVEPAMAERLLAEGQADAIEMSRALIADPDLPQKLRAGRLDEVRPCLLCNQDCVVNTVQNPRLSCAHNPAAGYEAQAEFGAPGAAPVPQRVWVVGGGPAGLEAARVAARRGHQVTLYEKRDRLGGTIRLAAAAPGRERLALAVDWLEAQLRRLPNVSINMGVEVTADLILAEAPQAVIVAVGGQAGPYPAVTFENGAPVLDPRQVLAGAAPQPPGKAVILDEAGDHPAMGAAEWLAGRGWQVEIVSEDMFIGQRLTATLELTPWNQRAPGQGIVFRPQLEVRRVVGRTIIAVDRFGRAEICIPEVDLVVSAAYEVPDEALYFALKQAGQRVYRAGDCVAPRRLGQAILEGYRVGRMI